MKNNSGMALVFTLIWLPVLILLLALCYRTGTTALNHFRVQRYLDVKALNTLAIQGKTLEALGNLNFHARAVIRARRAVDLLIKGGALAPPLIPLYVKTRLILLQTQRLIELKQKTLITQCQIRVLNELKHNPPKNLRKKISWSWKPLNPQLHISNDPEFAGELGAPKVLSPEFISMQNINLNSVIQSEDFLPTWKFKTPLPKMKLASFAKIQMTNLESNWVAQISSKEPQ